MALNTRPHTAHKHELPTITQHISDSSPSEDNDEDDVYADRPPSPWSGPQKPGQAESMVGVSISRAQTRLASAATPAIEKDEAIKRDGGYFSLDGIVQDASDESPLSDLNLDGANDRQGLGVRQGNATHRTILVKLPEEVSLPQSSRSEEVGFTRARSNSDSTTTSSATESQFKRLHSRRPPATIRRASSEDALSLRRAMSTASSLGDDTRFENVKEQVNSRFKAIKDSFVDSTFRLPPMPRFPSILSVSKSSTKEDDANSSDSTRKTPAKESVLSFRNRSALPKPLSIKNNQSAPSNQPTSTFASAHPYFTRAMQELTGDLVVMGGYRGSILRSRESPHSRCWIPLKAGFNLAKVNLEVGLDDEDEERMSETIYPDGMLTNIGPVDISRRLFKKLRNSPNVKTGQLRVINYGYDWRLSPHRLSRELVSYIEQLPCNSADTPPAERGAWVLAHSLGGLIIRHAVNQRPDLFRGVIYAGTPNTCINILGPLRNGDDVLFNSKILTAQVNFTIRTSFALLPLDGKCFVDEITKEELPVDFFDVRNWIKYELSPCVIRSRRRSSLAHAKNGILHSIPQTMSRSIGDVVDNIQAFGRRASIKLQNPGENHDSSNNTVSNQMSGETGIAPQMSANDHEGHSKATSRQRNNACSIPYPVAVEYLTRTLAAVKNFKQELAPIATHAESNLYPPAAVIFGKSEPTVSAARVKGYKAIPRADAYDNLAFASGDGVVLARAAMLPDGYKAVKGGVIASDRGHITLLGDLEAVGRAFVALMRARSHGVGIGPPSGEADDELEEKSQLTTSIDT